MCWFVFLLVIRRDLPVILAPDQEEQLSWRHLSQQV